VSADADAALVFLVALVGGYALAPIPLLLVQLWLHKRAHRAWQKRERIGPYAHLRSNDGTAQ
jgi:hypothetical protein